MEVKFENCCVSIYKLRKGELVRYDNQFYFLENVEYTLDRRILITIKNSFEECELSPQFVEWLNPN